MITTRRRRARLLKTVRRITLIIDRWRPGQMANGGHLKDTT